MDSVETVKRRLLANRDDSVEGTLIHSLWENGHFDAASCESMVCDFEALADLGALDTRITELARWVLDGVDLVFRSHHDPNDLSAIENYVPAFEQRWISNWEPRLRAALRASQR